MHTHSITAIAHEIVKNAPNGAPAKVIAQTVGRDYQTLMSELSRQPGHKLGADLLVPLMRAAGSTGPLDAMAADLHMVCTPLPASVGGHYAHKKCMLAVRDFGRLMASTADAVQDGIISNQERQTIAAKGYEALVSIVSLLQSIEDVDTCS